MGSFTIFVVRNKLNHFPYRVSLIDDAVAEAGCEVVEATVVSNEILLYFKDQFLHANNLLEASKDVMDNQVKDLADAGRALARMQRERDQLEAKIEDLKDEVLTLQAENAALKAQVRNAQLQGGGL